MHAASIFILSYHILLLILWPLYFCYYTPSLSLILTTIVLYGLCGITISTVYHRCFSHSACKIHKILEGFSLFFGTMAGQGSVLSWASDHRRHHAFVDTDRDPYSINKGFWYAHIWWLFTKENEIDPKVISDLLKNKLLAFQHKHYAILFITTNCITTFLVGFWLNDYVGAFVFALWTRIFLVHHSTWFINSLAHYWGAQSFSKEVSAVDNYLISLVTFGEGYHNYHHTFANDYRNGIRWYHFDPGKWLLWVLSKLGLAHSLKKAHPAQIKRRHIIEHKNDLLEKPLQSTAKEHIIKITDEMLAQLSHIEKLTEKYRGVSKEIRASLKSEIKSLKEGIRRDWKSFKLLYNQLLESP